MPRHLPVQSRLPAGQISLTGATCAGLRYSSAEARALVWLAARTNKIATMTEQGIITLPSLSLANAASMIELGGLAVWECLTENQKAVLMARNVVFREAPVKPV